MFTALALSLVLQQKPDPGFARPDWLRPADPLSRVEARLNRDRAQSERVRMVERKRARSVARSRARSAAARQQLAAEMYYRQNILPQQQRAAYEAARVQADLMRAQGMQALGAAAMQEAITDRQRLNLQRQAAGYPVPGLNPYNGLPLPMGPNTTPVVVPGVNFP